MSHLSRQGLVRLTVGVIAALIAVQSPGAAASHPFSTPQGASSSGATPVAPTAPLKPGAAARAMNNQANLSFIRNSGLAAPEVRYFAQTAGAGFSFEASRAVFTFTRPSEVSGTRASAEARLRSSTIALRFVGANPHVQVEARSRAAGVVNYLVGNDPSGWQRNLPTWQEVVYRDLWPGIDMVFHGSGGELKYEFLLRAGANPSRIQLAYEGAQDVSLDAQGALQVRTALGTVKDAAPVTWQDTEAGREPVDSRFVKNAGGAFGFAIGAYDRAAPLTIDPGLLYSTLLGGAGGENVYDMAMGADGSLYLAGSTSPPNFITGAQPYDLGTHDIPGTSAAVLVAKISPNGRDLVYATLLSASGYSEQSASGIAVDAAGAAYVTGLLNSSFNNAECGCFTDFPTTPGAYQRDIPPQYYGGEDGAYIAGPQPFALKLDPSGTNLEYSTLLGGSGWEDQGRIALGPAGTVYVSGTTYSTDFETTTGQQAEENGDAYVVQLNADGSRLLASTLIQGTGSEYAGTMVANGGNVYIVGQTNSGDLPATYDLRASATNNGTFGFVAKLSGAALSPQFLTLVPMSAVALALDDQSRMFVMGMGYTQNLWVSEDAFQKTMAGRGDGYVARIAADGSTMLNATYLGGPNEDRLGHLAIGPSGDVIVSGISFTSDYPTTPDAFQRTLGGPDYAATDLVVSRLSADLSQLVYSTYIGGSAYDLGGAMAVDPAGAVWLAGDTQSANFPVTPDAMQPTFGGEQDAFLLKLDVTPGAPPTPPNTPAGAATTITAADNGASVGFGAVTTAGVTTVVPVDAASLPLTLPGGFAISGAVQAYEIHTTAGVSGITVCLTASALDDAAFNSAVILHGVNGAWQPEPTTRSATARTLCAAVAALSPFAVGIPLDTVAPTITCAAAPAGWSADNVALSCSAVDQGAGLANPADASFSLTTQVGAGIETANAATSSRTVCDSAGNCATAAAIGGIKIDRKAPIVQITAPINRTFIVNESVTAAYGCTDGGLIAACAGTVANGSRVDTRTAGAKTLSVTARDAAGNVATQSVSYTVGFQVRSVAPAALSVKRGSPVPVAIQLTDAANANVSSASVVVTVRGLRAVSSGAVLPLKDSAWLNPDHNFRFALGAYGYALGTKALTPGIYELQFTAANDPVTHTLQFRVVK